MNLSSASILLCFLSLTNGVFSMVEMYDKEANLGPNIHFGASHGFVVTYYLSMISLTSDRLLMSILSIKYRMIMTTRKTKMILMMPWIIGQAFGLDFAL